MIPDFLNKFDLLGIIRRKERWPSGRRRVTRNHVLPQGNRGFESLSLRIPLSVFRCALSVIGARKTVDGGRSSGSYG